MFTACNCIVKYACLAGMPWVLVLNKNLNAVSLILNSKDQLHLLIN